MTCVNLYDAQAYVSWLSQRTGANYRLPTEAEWARAAQGSDPGCYRDRTGSRGTCTVGSYGWNGLNVADMVGNLWEWTEACPEDDDCRSRVLRGGSWTTGVEDLVPGAWIRNGPERRVWQYGFRVSKTLD